MFRIGCHISSANGYLAMAKDAWRIGANTFQFFTRNPRGGRAKELVPEDIARFLAFVREHDIASYMAHASYTLNPATIEKRLENFVRETMADDFRRLEHTPGAMYNFHPGSRKTQTPEHAAVTIARNLDSAMFPDQTTLVLLETMSGHGTEMGGVFEELKMIMDVSANGPRLGVCLDTCHLYDGGFDIVGDLDGVLTRFDKAVGLDRLKAIHLNDSLFGFASHKDRHARLGEGKIGWDALGRVINHPALRELPFYLETPNDLDGYAEEIAELKKRRVCC